MDTDKGIILIHSLGSLQPGLAALILGNVVSLVTNQAGVVNIRARMIEGSSISCWYNELFEGLSKDDAHLKFLINRNVEVYPNEVDHDECLSNRVLRDDYELGAHKLQLAGGRSWAEGVSSGAVDRLYCRFMATKRAMLGSVDINAATSLILLGNPSLFNETDELTKTYMSTVWRYIDGFGVDSFEFVDTSPLGLVRRGVPASAVFGDRIRIGRRKPPNKCKDASVADVLLSTN